MDDLSEKIGSLLRESGAILNGHFLLTSGRHSAVYFEKFRLLEEPGILSQVCEPIAEFFRPLGLTHVAGPTTGGIIIAFEVARQLGLPAIYVESENGKRLLRRGKTLPENALIGVVDDVLTTGISLRETGAALEEAGGKIAAYGVLINRAGNLDLGLPLHSAYEAKAESFAPDEVPEWLEAIPVTKPGTRVIA